MKKVLFLTTTIIALVLGTSYAQNTNTVLGSGYDNFYNWHHNTFTLDGYNGKHAIYSGGYYNIKKKDINGDCLFMIDAEGRSVTQSSLEHHEDFYEIRAFDNEEEVIVLYSYFNKKVKKFGLYMNKMSKVTASSPWDPEELLAITTEKSDGRYIYTAVSPDKSKFALLLVGADRKNNMEGAILMMFDNNGNLLWENNVNFEFTNKTFGMMDILVSNEGEVNCALMSYSKVGNNGRNNDHVHLMTISQDNATTIDQSIDFGCVSNGRLLVKKDGSVALAGYYATTEKECENGTYAIIFNTSAGDASAVSNTPFPSDYKESAGYFKAYANYVVNQRCHVIPMGIYEFENGTIGLVGEQHGFVAHQSQNGTYYVLVAKNIMYNAVEDNGVQELKMISKLQSITGAPNMSYQSQKISFFPFFANNTIYLLYNDHADNYKGDEGKWFTYNLNHKKAVLGMRTIAANGDTELKGLLHADKTGMYVERVLFMEEDGFILLNRAKKGESLSKVNVEF